MNTESDLSTLTPEDFERLIAALLWAEKFKNVVSRGSSGDGGVDVQCLTTEQFGNQEITRKIAAQCKHYVLSDLHWSKVENDVSRAKNAGFEYFILATSAVVKPILRQRLRKADGRKMRIIVWAIDDIEVLLGKHPELAYRFLGRPLNLLAYSSGTLAERYPLLRDLHSCESSPVFSQVVAFAFERALELRTAATVAHLGLALLDSGTLDQILNREEKLTLHRGFSAIVSSAPAPPAETVSLHAPVPLTNSLALTILGAKSVTQQMGLWIVDELSLAYSLFAQDRSESVIFMDQIPLLDRVDFKTRIYWAIVERYPQFQTSHRQRTNTGEAPTAPTALEVPVGLRTQHLGMDDLTTLASGNETGPIPIAQVRAALEGPPPVDDEE